MVTPIDWPYAQADLGIRFAELGRAAEALPPTQEGVCHLPGAGRRACRTGTAPTWPAALGNLGIRLSALGRAAEALPPTQEAADIYRELAAALPDRYRPGLAHVLASLGIRLSELGHLAEALPPRRGSGRPSTGSWPCPA